MFNITFGKKKGRIIAVADVGSGSAGFAILESRPGGAATILAASRSILPLDERSREQTIAGVLRMLSKAVTDVLRTYQASDVGKRCGPLHEIHAIIRAPWTRASAGHASKRFSTETLITRGLITKLAHEALENNKELDRARQLETAVIRVELNDYQTSSPIGKRAREIGIETFESDCDPEIRSGVEAVLGSFFPGRTLSLHSGARAYLTVVQEKTEHPDAYVIINMGSEATTIMVVEDGVIMHYAIMPEGVRTILRRLTGKKGTSEEVMSLLNMVVAGSCSGEECDRLNGVLARVEPDIVRAFGKTIGSIMGKRRLPDTLILFVHHDILAWLAHVFARIDFAQFTIPLRPFTVTQVSTEKLRGFVKIDSAVPVDMGILVASSFVNM